MLSRPIAPATAVVQRPTLTVTDAMAIVIGIVIGAGIYEVPSLVASNAQTTPELLVVWLFGGILSFLGAICVAELATAYPDSGGLYHYIRLAFGDAPAFLYAWARLAIIQTGSIALLSFVFGDYATHVLPLGPYSSSIYAALAIAFMTALNVRDVRFGRWTQKLLTLATVAGLALVIVAGVLASPTGVQNATREVTHSSVGLMLVFVLLTYGGWSEAAYIAAELRDGRRAIVLSLVGSIVFITAAYIAVNWALVRGLGLNGMAQSKAVAADLVSRGIGPQGATLLSFGVAAAVLSSMHGTMFTGARTNYAMGRDFPLVQRLGVWRKEGDTPSTALIVQAGVALALVAIGTATRQGFKTMVEFTAPVFWLFFLLTGIALIVLRRRDPGRERRFRVPGYPLTPILFCATSAYLLYSSLVYTGLGAGIGVAVLVFGALIYQFGRTKSEVSSPKIERDAA